MTQHTPGPWTASIPRAGGTMRADVRAQGEFGPQETIAVIWKGGDVGTADARLIEAAPEMHEILYKFAAMAVVRGRCIWCSHPSDAADGKHADTCIVPRAAALVARHGEAVSA